MRDRTGMWLAVSFLALLVTLAGGMEAGAQEDIGDGGGEDDGSGGDACDGARDVRARQIKFHVIVEWEAWSFARAYEVYRAEGDGPFEQVAVTSGDNPDDGEVEPHTTHFLDDDIRFGVTYHYQVQALGPPPHLGEVCGTATVHAVDFAGIPEFPTLFAVGVASVVAVVVYVAARRHA